MICEFTSPGHGGESAAVKVPLRCIVFVLHTCWDVYTRKKLWVVHEHPCLLLFVLNQPV